MVESNILYEQLSEHEDTEQVERTLISLIHESFDDIYTDVQYHASEEVFYQQGWIDPGRMCIDGYTVKRRGEHSYLVRLSCSYDELLPKECPEDEEMDFFDTVDGHIVYKLTVQCGPKVHTGQGRVFVIPKA